jgi:hypothetical protein
MTDRYIVVHKVHGIFLGMVGEANGMFSLVDPCGIYLTVSFDEADFARRLMAAKFPFKLDEYRFISIPCSPGERHIEPERLVDIGLAAEAAPLIQVKRKYFPQIIH